MELETLKQNPFAKFQENQQKNSTKSRGKQRVLFGEEDAEEKAGEAKELVDCQR